MSSGFSQCETWQVSLDRKATVDPFCKSSVVISKNDICCQWWNWNICDNRFHLLPINNSTLSWSSMKSKIYTQVFCLGYLKTEKFAPAWSNNTLWLQSSSWRRLAITESPVKFSMFLFSKWFPNQLYTKFKAVVGTCTWTPITLTLRDLLEGKPRFHPTKDVKEVHKQQVLLSCV